MTDVQLFAMDSASPLIFEQRARARGCSAIAGIDEAGRGPLAGPVVAAAVILPEAFSLPGLTDSKKLTARQRATLYPHIRSQAAVGVGVASVIEIDKLNILQATLLAMQRAVKRLPQKPDHLLIDGITPLPVTISQQCIRQGDSRSLSVAAASVIAKQIRDHIMLSLHKSFPHYDFARHKGYGTRLHREALQRFGPCCLHRKTFAGVRELL